MKPILIICIFILPLGCTPSKPLKNNHLDSFVKRMVDSVNARHKKEHPEYFKNLL